MAAKTNLLSAARCNNATSEGKAIRKLHDGGGLCLWVYLDGGKFWRLRYGLGGKEKSLSFGSYPQISLKEARAKRDEQHKLLDADRDPSAERKAANLRKKLTAENSFEAVALRVVPQATAYLGAAPCQRCKAPPGKQYFPDSGETPYRPRLKRRNYSKPSGR